jgi:membrane-bound lytic murein transglycosylase B
MLNRRHLLAAPAALALAPVGAAAQGRGAQAASFPSLLSSIAGEARAKGVSSATIDRAFAGVSLNQKVLELYHHQPEFTLTWAQYRARVITEQKIGNGRAAYQQHARTFLAVDARYRVTAGVIAGIWGIESAYGQITGSYGVVEALATLTWEGHRAPFFRSELIDALRIIDHGDVSPGRMTGSYAGAMGQPQFMPDSYLRFAVDMDGDGRRDIWTSTPDVLGSIANYLARSGWRYGEPWGQPIRMPPGFDAGMAGRENRKPLAQWMQLGVTRIDGSPFARGDVTGAVLMPDGAGGEAFMVYANFAAIRRYNPSDFYALAVGLLGDAVV